MSTHSRLASNTDGAFLLQRLYECRELHPETVQEMDPRIPEARRLRGPSLSRTSE